LKIKKAQVSKKIAVVGAGPAGMSCALTLAQRGHKVALFDKDKDLGGQFLMAKDIPGKEEFKETLRYFKEMLAKFKVTIYLKKAVTEEDLKPFEEVVLATGVVPRVPPVEGINHKKVLTYIDVLKNKVQVGQKVAIMGAGGIGFDVAEFLLQEPNVSPSEFFAEWGVDERLEHPGGIIKPKKKTPKRQVYLMQRKAGKLGAGLGKTTGWIHRTSLKHLGAEMLSAITYLKIDDQGLHYKQDKKDHVLEVDHVVICAGQESYKPDFFNGLSQKKHIIGGAFMASELDAQAAIDLGVRRGLEI
jgi:2,4-dienoyl-CoA reductase (NADPH2)